MPRVIFCLATEKVVRCHAENTFHACVCEIISGLYCITSMCHNAVVADYFPVVRKLIFAEVDRGEWSLWLELHHKFLFLFPRCHLSSLDYTSERSPGGARAYEGFI